MVSITYQDALDIMKDDRYSQLEKVTTRKSIILPPKYLGNIKTGVTRQLDSELQLSSQSFQGVPIAYNDIKLLGSMGSIMDDKPFLHFDIQADFIVFRPVIGCTLKGVVNKIFKNHVGCLVHGCFNASIHKPHHVVNSWEGHTLNIGEEFMFEVTGIFTNNMVLSLRGDLKDSSGHKKQKKGQTPADNNLPTTEMSSLDSSTITEEDVGRVRKKKKKKKSNKDIDENDTSAISLQTSLDNISYVRGNNSVMENSVELNGSIDSELNESQSKKKKKKKKKKMEKELIAETAEESVDADFSSHKKKKKKKKKDSDSELVREIAHEKLSQSVSKCLFSDKLRTDEMMNKDESVNVNSSNDSKTIPTEKLLNNNKKKRKHKDDDDVDLSEEISVRKKKKKSDKKETISGSVSEETLSQFKLQEHSSKKKHRMKK